MKKTLAVMTMLAVLTAMIASAAWKRNPDTGIRDYYEPAATDANITTTDVTTNNVSTSKHGFCPKAPNDATKFLDGTAAWDTVKDSDLSTSDITTNDVSTSKHGFTPKAPNDTTKYLRGDATWAVPANTGYALVGSGATFDPADGAVLYFGSYFDTAPTTSAAYRKIYIPKAGTIKAVYVGWIAGTAGTGENVTVAIRLNNTTDTTIATVGNTSDNKEFSNTALSIAVAQGDYIEFKITCPTWVTNPLNVKVTGSIYVE